jgi:hypothetical protein
MRPDSTFWLALLAFGVVATASNAAEYVRTSGLSPFLAGLAGAVVLVTALSGLRDGETMTGPQEWGLLVYGVVVVAALYAASVAADVVLA